MSFRLHNINHKKYLPFLWLQTVIMSLMGFFLVMVWAKKKEVWRNIACSNFWSQISCKYVLCQLGNYFHGFLIVPWVGKIAAMVIKHSSCDVILLGCRCIPVIWWSCLKASEEGSHRSLFLFSSSFTWDRQPTRLYNFSELVL